LTHGTYVVDPLGEGRYRVVHADTGAAQTVSLRGKFTDCDCDQHRMDGPPCEHIVAMLEYVTSVAIVMRPVTIPEPLHAGDLTVEELTTHLRGVITAMHELTMQQVELEKAAGDAKTRISIIKTKISLLKNEQMATQGILKTMPRV